MNFNVVIRRKVESRVDSGKMDCVAQSSSSSSSSSSSRVAASPKDAQTRDHRVKRENEGMIGG